MASSRDSAFLLVQKLRNQHYIIKQNAYNPSMLTGAFCTISECVSNYFTFSHQVEQSAEARVSMENFCWLWVELPHFPLRRFLPLAAKALQNFPEHKGLVLVIADMVTDICKQNVLAKMEAMRCGIIQGLCLAAGQLAALDTLDDDDYLLTGRIFEAIQRSVETPGIDFYARPRETKEIYYEVAREAWSKVDLGEALKSLNGSEDLRIVEGPPPANHGLLTVLHFLKKYPDPLVTKHYLEVMSNIGEAFDKTFPTVAENEAFQALLKDTLETSRAPGQPQSFWVRDVDTIDETLLILKRTANPSENLWDHRDPYLLPSLNRLHRAAIDPSPLALQIYYYNERRAEYRAMIIEKAREYTAALRESSEGPSASSSDASAEQTEAQPQPRSCGYCALLQGARARGEPAFSRCTRCRTTYYCGKECQRAHWREHRAICVPPS